MAKNSEQELAIRIAGKIESSFKNSLGLAQDGIDKLADTAKKAAAVAATAFAALQVKEFAGDCVSAAMDFESSMADVAKVVDGLKDENGNLTDSYHEMSNALIGMSKNIPMTADELAQIMAAAGQAGVATEDLEQFTETAAKMGVAFDATAEQAGEWMAIWRTALDLNQEEVESLGDQINYLGNTSSENALKLSEIVTQIGSLAKISGVSAGDLAALGAATTGIDANVAATGLKNMFVAMGQGEQATKKQVDILEKLGFTATEVAERMQTDSKGMIMDLLAEINKLPKAEQEAAISGYFGKESLATVAVLASNLDNLEDQFSKVADATQYTGSMQSEYAARAATSANNVQLLKNRFQALKIQLGTYLLPVVNTTLSVFSDFIDIFSDVASESKDAFAVLERGAGTAANIVKDFFQGMKDGKGIVESLNSALKDNLGSGIPPELVNTINQAQDAFLFLKETGVNTFNNIKTVVGDNQPIFDKIIEVVKDLKDRLFEAFENAKPTITFLSETALPSIVDALLKVTGGAADVVDAFVEWDGFLPTITAIGVAVGAVKFYQLVTGIYAAAKAMAILNIAKMKDMILTAAIRGMYIQDAIVKAASTVQTYAAAAGQWVWNAAATAGTAITSALGAAFAFLTSPIGLVILAIAAIIAIGVLLWKNWDVVKEKAGQLGEWISSKFQAMREAIGNAVEGFKNKFPVVFAFIRGVFNGFKATVDRVIDGVKQVFQGIIDFVQGVFTGNWQQALDGLKNIFSGTFDALSALAMSPLDALNGVVTGAFDAINTATGGKLSEIKDKASEAWNNIKDTAGSVLQGAQDTISGILENIRNAFSDKMEAAKNVVSNAIEAIKGFFNFEWSLPELKLPHFSIAGDFNINPPQVPSFGVEWYRDGGIMTNPTVFGMNGNKAMIGGEAGAEAILPLETLWDKMGAFIDIAINKPSNVIGSAIRILAGRIDDFFAGEQKPSLELLSDDISKVSYLGSGEDDPGRPVERMNITYAPVYHFDGPAPTKADIVQAEKMSQSDFDKMMRQWQKDRDRLNF